jgi:hypothetical protein
MNRKMDILSSVNGEDRWNFKRRDAWNFVNGENWKDNLFFLSYW